MNLPAIPGRQGQPVHDAFRPLLEHHTFGLPGQIRIRRPMRQPKPRATAGQGQDGQRHQKAAIVSHHADA